MSEDERREYRIDLMGQGEFTHKIKASSIIELELFFDLEHKSYFVIFKFKDGSVYLLPIKDKYYQSLLSIMGGEDNKMLDVI
jgi:hypothetical protein